MNNPTIQQKPIPKDTLRSLGVAIVYLFGSHAQGVAGPGSDIDIGVVYANPSAVRRDINKQYQALYDLFTDIFDMRNFREIDIVFLDRAPLELCFDVISHGHMLFEATHDVRMNFEERISALYRDFKPLLEESNRAVLQRV